MRSLKPVFILSILFMFFSCEVTNTTKNNNYQDVQEIQLPTDSPWGIAYDGDYLWYSDDSLNSLYKISEQGEILRTISLPEVHLTGFDFYKNNIWCINDTTVMYDKTISTFPFSCIYKVSLTGQITDSILVKASVNPQKPELLDIVIKDFAIYGSTHQGYSSCLYKINLNSRKQTFLHYYFLSGLTIYNDTIYSIYNGSLVPFDSDYEIMHDKAVKINSPANDLVFVKNELWVCDRKNRKLRKVKF